jgi:hypothetical protein
MPLRVEGHCETTSWSEEPYFQQGDTRILRPEANNAPAFWRSAFGAIANTCHGRNCVFNVIVGHGSSRRV